MEVDNILKLEPKPSIMPPVNGWLAEAKVKLQNHFDHRDGNFPVYDRAVIISK